MDFDRTCIIKASTAALETLVLKPILSANAKECFLAREHKIQIVPEEKLLLSLRHPQTLPFKEQLFPLEMDLVIDIVMLIGQIQTQVISRTGNGKTFGDRLF